MFCQFSPASKRFDLTYYCCNHAVVFWPKWEWFWTIFSFILTSWAWFYDWSCQKLGQNQSCTWFGSSLPILRSLLQVLIVPACLEARDFLPTKGTELFRPLTEGAQLAQVHVWAFLFARNVIRSGTLYPWLWRFERTDSTPTKLWRADCWYTRVRIHLVFLFNYRIFNLSITPSIL
jgi:hypothetical protein